MLHIFKTFVYTALLAMTLMLSMTVANASEPLDEFEQAMEQYQGKVVYLDFWASWCVPCRKSFPWMNAMQAKYKEEGLVILSVNLDAKASFAEVFLQETSANFAVIYDAKGKLAKKFQLKGMPSSYLFNRQGELISAHNGFNGKKQQKYEQEIVKALARK